MLALMKRQVDLALATRFGGGDSRPEDVSRDNEQIRCAQERLDETIRFAVASARAVEMLFPPGEPQRGTTWLEVGKLYSVDEFYDPTLGDPSSQPSTDPPHGLARLELAFNAFVHAREELQTVFREGDDVIEEVRRSIISLSQEMHIWKTGVRNVVKDVVASRKNG